VRGKLRAPALRRSSFDLEEIVVLPAVECGLLRELVHVDPDGAIRCLSHIAGSDHDLPESHLDLSTGEFAKDQLPW
jgi:hypothetical protein